MNNAIPYPILRNLILFVLFSFFQIPLAFTNTITDLTTNSWSSFNSEAASWGSTGLNGGTKVSSCWGDYIMGGYDILSDGNGYFWKTFSGLATPHNTVYFTMKAFQIDSWDGGDAFNVYLNGYWIYGWEFPRPSGWTADACGGNWEEIKPVLIRATVPHTGSTFAIQVHSSFNQGSTDESFGFREISLTTDTTSSPSFYYCGVTAGNYLPYNWCPCTSHQYTTYAQSGICIECDVNCQTCDGSPTTCLTCYPGWFMVGTYCYPTCTYPLYSAVAASGVTYCYTPCPGQYAYWDQSCGATCDYTNTWHNYPTIYPEIESTYSKCMFPCGTSQFLAWNNSCLAACPDPLVTDPYKSRNFCAYPCTATQYLAWNQSCLSSCPYPLSPETQGSYLPKQFCWYTCQPTQYLYFNQSCINTCPYPLSPEVQGTFRQRNFCWYACMPWQWLNWDQTCQETCVAPLWPETVGNPLRNFCWYPCTSEAKYLYWNTSCLPECPKPLKTRYENGQWFCDYPCPTTQWLYWNGSCISSCNSPLWSKIEGSPARRFCYYPCPVNQFAYWDNTCQSSCDFPLVPNSEGNPIRQFCWYLCPTTQYLYWNGSCNTQCNFPLSLPRITNDRNFCDYPCQINEFLFWNGSCLATCPYPLSVRVEGTLMKRNFCDFLCAPTKFLYWNGSCLDTCDFPLSIRNEGDASYPRKFCDYPCNGNQYLYWNGTCMYKCELPLIIRIEVNKRYCDYLCPPTQAIYWDGTCGPICNSPLIPYSQGSLSRNYCKYPCEIEQFLYPNGTCSDNCNFPLTSSIIKSRLLCHYPCSSTQFLYWNGLCLNSCDFPLSTRTDNSWQFCDYPCEVSEYLYWNGSCSASCAFPLTPRITADQLYCDFTCPTSTDYLYWNGTCDSDCPFPLTSTQVGSVLPRNYCASKCPTEYLYWNGSCHNTCHFPLSTRLNNGTHFCDYPCLFTEFLYWNATCSDACLYPLSTRIDAGNNYCDKPCKHDEEYVFWNGTCSALCDFPLQTRNESNMLYCDYPCDPLEYLFFTGICIPDCLIPHQPKIEGDTILRSFCVHNCSSDEFLYWNGSCREVCQSPHRTIYNNSIRYCEKPCEDPADYYHETFKGCKPTCEDPSYSFFNIDYLACKTPDYASVVTSKFSNFDFFLYAPLKEGTPTVVSLVKAMQYVRYINMNMPPRLERLAKSKGRNIMSIKSGFTMWDGLKINFKQQVLPEAYNRMNPHSSFLVNYWEDFSMILIGIFLGLLFLCFERLTRALEMGKAEVVFHTLRVLTMWNFVIMMIAINIDDVILYSALQIKSWNPADTDNSSTTISFILSLVAILTVSTFFGVICYLLSQLKANSPRIKGIKTRTDYIPMTSAEESYQIIFKGLREGSVCAQFFFPFYIIRIAIPSVIFIAAESIPILNTVMQMTFSGGVLTFIVCAKPFTKRINHIQLVIFETLILIMNFLMVIITLISINDKENYKVAIFLGDLVILGNDLINIMSIIFLIIKLHIGIKQIREYSSKKIVQGNELIGLWVQLLYIPLQQAHMGFEEFTAYPTKILQARPHTRLPLEESETSIKKNIAEENFTEGVMMETNRQFLDTEVHHLNEIKITQNDTMSSPNMDFPRKENNRILKTPPTLIDDELQKSPGTFRLDPPTFDRDATIDFSMLDNPSKHHKCSKKIVFQGIENNGNNDFNIENQEDPPSKDLNSNEITNEDKQGENERISEEETLDLENNDDVMIKKIRKNLDTLNKHIDGQAQKEGKQPYLKKNEGINRKKHQ